MNDNTTINFINEMTLLMLEAKKLDKMKLDDENISVFINNKYYSLKNGLMEVTYSLGRGNLTIEFDTGHYSFNKSLTLKLDLMDWLDDTRRKIERVKNDKGGEVK